MFQVIVIVLLFLMAVVWWRHAVRPKKQLIAPAIKQDARSHYHCVEVSPGVSACEAAQSLRAIRYLSDEAPLLPVPGCNAQHCACNYVHYDDRREDDRRNPYGIWASLPSTPANERRSRTERRKSQESVFRPSIAN